MSRDGLAWLHPGVPTAHFHLIWDTVWRPSMPSVSQYPQNGNQLVIKGNYVGVGIKSNSGKYDTTARKYKRKKKRVNCSAKVNVPFTYCKCGLLPVCKGSLTAKVGCNIQNLWSVWGVGFDWWVYAKSVWPLGVGIKNWASSGTENLMLQGIVCLWPYYFLLSMLACFWDHRQFNWSFWN